MEEDARRMDQSAPRSATRRAPDRARARRRGRARALESAAPDQRGLTMPAPWGGLSVGHRSGIAWASSRADARGHAKRCFSIQVQILRARSSALANKYG